MSRTTPRSLAAALDRLAADIAPSSTLARVQAAWARAAGPAVAAAARPLTERDGVLTVACESSVWAQELDLMAPTLIERLNAELDGEQIRELRCRTG